MNVEQESLLDYAVCTSGNNTTYSYYNLSLTSSIALYFHAAVLGIVIVFGVCANALVLLLMACDKRLRHRSTYAALNIVLVDFLLTIFYHGVALTSILRKEWPYGSEDVGVCRLYSFMSPYFIYVRWIALFLICVDRFLTVRFPFLYERHNKAFLVILTVLVWLLPIVFGGLIVVAGRPTFRANVPTCIVSCVNESGRSLCQFLNIILFTATFIIGGVIPSVLYTWMYYKGRKLRPKLVLGTFASSSSIESNFSRRQSSNEVNREQRTLVTLIVVYLSVALTSLPQYIVLLIRGVQVCYFFKIPIFVHFIVSDIFFLSTALDPIVLMRTREFRVAFKQYILRRKPPLTNTNYSVPAALQSMSFKPEESVPSSQNTTSL